MKKKRRAPSDDNSTRVRRRDHSRFRPSVLDRIPPILWIGLALVASTLVATTPIGDNDYGFHLRLGSEIAQSGPPATDSHSFTAPGAPYPDHEWLSQLLWFQAHRVCGDAGMVAFQALLVGGALAIVAFTIRGRSLLIALFAVDAALLLGLHHVQMRPHLLSWGFTALLGWLLDRRLFAAVPPLLLVWANCHGSVPLAAGWSVLALTEEFRAKREKKLLVIALASVLAPLANPYGIGVYTLFFKIAAHTGFIGEWKPYTPDTGAFWLLVAVFAMAAFGVASLRPFSPFDTVRVVGLAALAFRSSRHGVAAALYLAPRFAQWFNRPRLLTGRSPARLAAIPLALLPVVVLTMEIRRDKVFQFRLDHELLPIESVEFLDRHNLPGRLFNDYNFGGWLLWKGWPKYPVFIDGRTEVYKGAILDEYLATSRAEGGWKTTLDRWEIRTVLIRPERELARALLSDPDWGLVYFDYNSVIYVRNGSAPGVRRLEVVSPFGNRDASRPGIALAEVESLLGENPRFFGAWKIRAFLLARKGDWSGARDSLRRYLELHPEGKDVNDTRELVQRLGEKGMW